VFGDESSVARVVEADLVAGRHTEAVARIEGLIFRGLDAMARDAGLEGADATVLALAAGIDGRRWLDLMRLVRRARAGERIDSRDAVWAWALAIELRARR
jgi:hypothetical protein